jgi:hypothetical protein
MRTLRTLILALVPGAIALAQTITSTSPLPNGTVNVPYSDQLTCTNCTNGVWAVSSGSLPPVLSLNSSTGVISGTPSTAATYNFQISMTIIGVPPATKNFSLTIIPAVAINQGSIPSGVQNSPYSTMLTASGGTPPYSWSLTSPNSDGMTINGNSGAISGTPTAAGQFTLNVTVNDSNSGVASRSFTLTVAPPPIITTSSLPNGAVNQPYSAQETCTNCTGGSWSVSSGALPPVLSLNSQSGAISGTPTTAAIYNFQVMLTVPIGGGRQS